MKTTQVIDAEIIEEIKDNPRLLETVAEIAEKVARPFDRLPGGQRFAEDIRKAAVTVREVDGEIEAIKPPLERLIKRVKDLNLNPDREPLPR